MLKFFKSKIGFTLVELLVVVLILGIILAVGIPAYRNVAKNSRIKACNVLQRSIASDAKDYCYDNNFNSDFVYTIISDTDKGAGVIGDENEKEQTDAYLITLLKDTVHNGDVPYCPAGGIITVTIVPGTYYPTIEVSCDGGNDGDCHKAED